MAREEEHCPGSRPTQLSEPPNGNPLTRTLSGLTFGVLNFRCFGGSDNFVTRKPGGPRTPRLWKQAYGSFQFLARNRPTKTVRFNPDREKQTK
jgi:hypothetical protein